MNDFSNAPVVFDGHNDVLSKLARTGGVTAAPAFLTGLPGDIDLVRARSAGFGGGFFAIWVPVQANMDEKIHQMTQASYDLPLPPTVDQPAAMTAVMQQAAVLFELERLGALVVCRSAGDIRAALDAGQMAAIFHIEGAEAIGPDLHELDVLYHAGLRSLGPVWSRETIFAHGVPFRYPSSPDTGPGLTDAGKRLVARCDRLGVMIDLSHLNEAGFWDVAKLSTKPLVATHSCVHAISPHSRNLTDDQMRAIADSDGVAGLNFAAAFLRDDGRMLNDVPLSQVMRHLDHMIALMGEDRVALGSDYDGAICPADLQGIDKLPALRATMADHGYDAGLIRKLCHENWLRVLEITWGD